MGKSKKIPVAKSLSITSRVKNTDEKIATTNVFEISIDTPLSSEYNAAALLKYFPCAVHCNPEANPPIAEAMTNTNQANSGTIIDSKNPDTKIQLPMSPRTIEYFGPAKLTKLLATKKAHKALHIYKVPSEMLLRSPGNSEEAYAIQDITAAWHREKDSENSVKSRRCPEICHLES